jgi:4-diphosphocytidyl-2C-methyl-D-erythritol kinase
LPGISKLSLLVVVPREIRVPTPDAFRWVNAPMLGEERPHGKAAATTALATKTAFASRLTKSAGTHKLWEFCALCWSAQGSGLSNDFEQAVFKRHPRLAGIKRALLQAGAAEASLAGSGSAVFGVFPSPVLARRAAVGFPDDQAFVCETVSRDRYVRMVQGAL